MIHRALGDITAGQLSGTAPTLVVPVGATEQHGPHLPLDTDTRIATALARHLSAELDHLLAPALAYGASGEHQGFAGTVSIGTPTLTAVLVEYGRSACEWAARLVFVNGHGGNLDALRSAVVTLRRENRDAAWLSGRVADSDAHAGHTETSLMLHLAPHAVRRDQWVRGNTAPLEQLMPDLRRQGVAGVSGSGVLGDPTSASAAEGARMFGGMVADGVVRVRRWAPGPDGMLT